MELLNCDSYGIFPIQKVLYKLQHSVPGMDPKLTKQSCFCPLAAKFEAIKEKAKHRPENLPRHVIEGKT